MSVLLYIALFYQIRLYADALEQVYCLAASGYGWWYWSRSRHAPYTQALLIWLTVTVTVMGSIALGWIVSRVHAWAPLTFPEAASCPWLDALTTVMSLVAMWLMARRRIESWVHWIIVDVIGIGLYFVKEVRFVALLYAILLAQGQRGSSSRLAPSCYTLI